MMQDQDKKPVTFSGQSQQKKSHERKASLASAGYTDVQNRHTSEYKKLLLTQRDNKSESNSEALTDNEQTHYGAPDHKYQPTNTPQHSLNSNFETEQTEQARLSTSRT